MNFLAHLYLSGTSEKIMVGNFIGDFVKGRNTLKTFDPEIARGIELHRAIDLYTDTHPIVAVSKQRLRPRYRHYAGVIVDVFYDHFLARNWSTYHPDALPDFAQRAYQVIKTYSPVLPDRVRYMLPYMVRDNWLVSYARKEGIGQALSGMARRTRFDSKLDEATAELYAYDEAFASEFAQFFPDLRKHCAPWTDP